MNVAADFDAYLARIAARESEVHAFACFDAERARRLAREIEATFPSDAPLRGLPIGVKDVIDVAGLPTGMNSPLHGQSPAATSADLIESLERAGALILGKTVTAELAFLAPGPTRNPHNLAHSPGGSSSGSAAAVAAGFAAAAIGTQTNGSIIRPAAFCGVVGFKPSWGRISTRGVLSWSPALDVPGVFAADVATVRKVASVIDAALRPTSAASTRAPRLCAVRSPVWNEADAAQQAAFAAALGRLRDAGAEVVEAELPALFGEAHRTHRRIMLRDAALAFASTCRDQPDQISRQLHAGVEEGSRIGAAEYGEALALRSALQIELRRFLAGVDAIATPPATCEAPLGLESTGNATFCTIWSLCGVPAINLPVARGPRGLPLGLQLVGGFDDDDDLFATASWCEHELDFGVRLRPTPSPQRPVPN